MSEIFKAQKPLFQSFGAPMVLVYNESRSIEFQVPMDATWADVFGLELKIYIEASFEDEAFVIEDIVEDQDW